MTRYELLDRIGVGGMAEIFRGKAVAAGGFEKPVAIKRILPHLSADPRFVELLIAEAKVLSLLKHRNIVQIFDVGLGDDGKYFLVMEYVDGKDLGAVQRGLESTRKRMPLDLALSVGAEICDALEHAHTARGPDGKPMALVHRDVSPTNVLVSRAGEIKLTDFGIAKRAEESTGHGAVRGKFAYISPEQARNEHLNASSDLFAVGLLLWELVTGRRLYSALPDLEALRSVREAKVPAPSTADPRLPKSVDDLLLTALAADPAKRYPSAGAFAQQLRTLRYSLEVQTGDPATELGKLVDRAEQVQRDRERAPVRISVSRINAFPVEKSGEATVIRIHTAESFAIADEGTGLVKARQVIDKFDEEETRQANVSVQQVRELRGGRMRETGQQVPQPGSRPGMAIPGVAAKRPGDDEPTAAREPLLDEALADDSQTIPPDNAEATHLSISTEEMMRGDPAKRMSGLAGPPQPRPITLPGVQTHAPAVTSSPAIAPPPPAAAAATPAPSRTPAAFPAPVKSPSPPLNATLPMPSLRSMGVPGVSAAARAANAASAVKQPPQPQPEAPPPDAWTGSTSSTTGQAWSQQSSPALQPAHQLPLQARPSMPQLQQPPPGMQQPIPATPWHSPTPSPIGTPGSNPHAQAWRDATPAPQVWGAPAYQNATPTAAAQVPVPAAPSYGKQNLILAIGAVVVAVLAFVITRLALAH